MKYPFLKETSKGMLENFFVGHNVKKTKKKFSSYVARNSEESVVQSDAIE